MEDELLKKFFINIEDNLSKEIPTYNVFETNFGKESEKNFSDLITFCNASSLIPTLIEAVTQLNLNVPENLVKVIFDLLPQILIENFKNLDNNLDISKMQSSITEFTKSLLPNFIQSESIDLDKISEKNSLNNKEDNQNDLNLSELRILERVTSYFVLTLYAYIDIYSMELLKFFVGLLEANKLYEFMKKIKITENPEKRIQALLTYMKVESGSNLFKVIDDTMIDKNWKEYYREFTEFINIRNYIAHRDPSGAIEFMKVKLTKSWENAQIQAARARESINLDGLPAGVLQKFFKSFVDIDYEKIFLLQNLGYSCYRYLSLIDKFLILIHNKNIRIVGIA